MIPRIPPLVAGLVSTFAPMLWAGLILGAGFIAVPAIFTDAGTAKPFAYLAAARTFERLAMGEWVCAALLAISLAALGRPKKRTTASLMLLVLLAVQALYLRPELAARAAALAGGGALEPSPAHAIYAVLELFKLAWLGALAYAGFAYAERAARP